jgi:hypothetical protein
MMTMLTSTELVITVLGGNARVASMLATTAKAVSNWRSTDRFPAHTYVPLQQRLKKAGFSAPDALWPQTRRKTKRRSRR